MSGKEGLEDGVGVGKGVESGEGMGGGGGRWKRGEYKLRSTIQQ